MKPFRTVLLVPILAWLFGACTFHVHVHESAERAAPAREPQRARANVRNAEAIAGIAVDESGRPARVEVGVVSDAGSRTMRTGGDGRFRFDGLRKPFYDVTAWTERGRIVTLSRVPVGSEDLRLPPLRRGAFLEVRMTGRPSARVAVFRGRSRVHDVTLRDGRTRELVVPAGELRVELYGRDFEESRRIRLDVGGKTKLDFAR